MQHQNHSKSVNTPALWALVAGISVLAGACGGVQEPECRQDCEAPNDAGSTNDGSGSTDDESGGTDDESGSTDDESGSTDDESGGTDVGEPECPVDCEPEEEPIEEPALAHRNRKASNADVLNPERGLYSFADLTSSSFSSQRSNGISLVYGRVLLDAYRTSAIPASYLSKIENGFARARAAGVKVIPRFVYNKDGGGDASKAQILAHIAQLKPLLRANADVIATFQAGFIGRWGEWHGSTNGLDNARDRAEILRALLDAMPAERTVQVRTPHFKSETLGGPLTESLAFNGSDASRVGHHNDCLLASGSDAGTYKSPVQTWKNYVAEEGRFTPVGGESCKVNAPQTDCSNFKSELRTLHYSFLNNDYHPDVRARLISQGCWNEVVERLGYRLVLSSSALSEAVRPGGVLVVEADIRNDGYAAMFNARPVYLVLDGAGVRHELLLSALDPRTWEPGESVHIRKRLRVPSSLIEGRYRVSLWMPDAASSLKSRPEYAVRFANDGVWEPDGGMNVLGTLPVDADATGAVDATAGDFVEITKR